MNVDQILTQLRRNEGHFAKDAILEAVVRREEMIPVLALCAGSHTKWPTAVFSAVIWMPVFVASKV
jgi:hypothetical protein